MKQRTSFNGTCQRSLVPERMYDDDMVVANTDEKGFAPDVCALYEIM